MTTPAAATSVRHEIIVDAPIERAFSVFTDGFGTFKPPEHNLLGVEIAETIFEPREGGHVLSEVEICFVAESPDRTRVTLEHRRLDRHGDGWEGVREGVDSGGGWPLYLRRFADVVRA